MAVTGILSYALEIPDITVGVKFYTDAGLEASVVGNTAYLRCPGQGRISVILFGGAPAKRLHHMTLRATGIDKIASAMPTNGGSLAKAPKGFEESGLWITDPHGMLIHLKDDVPDDPADDDD